mmetsp:Transcript_1402/g.3220  ORF Transcript_1402/g.3220 Transcript_1402/m.3220 type:complete len:231 (+) Transcript_1402:52-744(+)
MIDGDEDPQCPECLSLLYNSPEMVLKYSTCCGRTLCENCIKNKFKSRSIIECPQCGERIGKNNWSRETKDQQLYHKGIRTRREKLANTFNLLREDFEKLEGYNDYLEFAADVEWAMVYGNESERKEAEAKMGDWSEKNKKLITSRRLLENPSTENTQMDVDRKSSTAEPWNAGFYVEQLPNKEPEAKRRENEERTTADANTVKRSGGFKFEYDRKRSFQEAMAGILRGVL